MKKLLLVVMLMICSISLAQRTFNYSVWRDADGNIKRESEAYLLLSTMDADGYITATTNNEVTKYYTYDFKEDVTNAGQPYTIFKIRNIKTGEKFLLQLFKDWSLGARIIDVNGETITLYDN